MRTIRSFLPLIVTALMLVACGSSAMSIAQPLPPGDGQTGSGSTAISDSTNPQQGKGVAPGPVLGAPVAGGPVTAGPIAVRDDAKIVRTGTLSLEVGDLGPAVRAARDAIVALGGYVGASTTRNDGDRPSAQITYRIPADRWEQALDQLRALDGLTTKVVAEHTEAVEVTAQVVDLDARIANLRASETALQAIAARAVKVSDVLEVEAQLTTTRGEIESLTAQLKDLNDRAGYATLTVDYAVPVVAVQAAAKGWDPTVVVDEAAASLLGVFQTLGTAGIWLAIVGLPILLVFGAVALVVVWAARRLGIGRRPEGLLPPTAPTAPIAGEG